MAQRSTSSAKKPVNEIVMGKIKACVWENVHDDKTFHNVTVVRIYKDGNDWKETHSFGRDDLPVLQKVVTEAWEWIYVEAKEQRQRDAA